MGFTENFNYCMEQRNYSAYRFAKILGVNIQSPVNWKTGASIPHYGTRQKIAEHFGITLAELDGDELPVLPPEDAKKAPAAKGEGVSAERKALLDIVSSLTDEQCRKLLVLVQGAKTVL
jgi:transcriptional regulator with XRE-family HTH domain